MDAMPDFDLALEDIELWWAVCRERRGWKHHPNYRQAFSDLDAAMNHIIAAQKLLTEIAEEAS